MSRRTTAVAVFARAPLPGRAKSRLIPRLGAWGAARLQAMLTRRALRTAADSGCGPIELHGSPRARQAFLARCAWDFGASLHDQRGRDLGERMLRAFRAGLRRHRAIVLIGSDCPALRARDLALAARSLAAGYDAVLAPAEDGGYALIALRRVSPRLFTDIAWGGERVLAQTRDRLRALGWRWRELRAVWDVDRPADYARLEATRLLARRSVRSLRLRAAARRGARR